jgi:hypothetical protein
MVEQVDFGARIPRSQWDAWHEEIAAIGITNPLTNFETNNFGQIDLERSHPGGFSQFVTGRATLLSNLVRDPLAYSRALAAARRINAKAERLSNQFGIQSLFLVGGLADFEGDGFDLKLPILMWPISLEKRGDDYELQKSGLPQVNPAFVDALEVCYGIKLNESELLARQNESSDLVPVTVLNYLANLTGEKAKLDLKRILVIGNFTTAPTTMLRDFERAETPLLLELTGEPKESLPGVEVAEMVLIADADATQVRIAARALSGQSFAVETLPGCGYLQTVLNTIGVLVNSGKKVLVVAPRRQTLNELADRLSATGLAGLGVRADSTWVDVVAAISRNERAQAVDLAGARGRRLVAEQELDGYFKALDRKVESLGVSVSEILRKLSELSAMPHPPLTNARIDAKHLTDHLDRSNALAILTEAEELGEFKFGPQDTAWYQAQFDAPGEVEQAIALAKRLRDDAYPNLSAQLADYIANVNFKPAASVEEFGVYLKLFMGVRETHDRFVADVFDRPLTELIAATAPRKGVEKADRAKMSGVNRRRLKKLAKEYLRPGMHVADLHVSLLEIQHQRELWQRFSLADVKPQVPAGINDAQVAYQSFVADLEAIQRHLDPESTEVPLVKLDLAKLKLKLQSLAEDTEALGNLGDRAMLAGQLRASGLGPLARDLGRLHTSKDRLAVELDLAWWQSALEYALAQDSSILNYSAELLDAHEDNFRNAYDVQIDMGAKHLAKGLSDAWHAALQNFSEEAQNLKAVLKTGSADIPALRLASPSIWPILAPVQLISPFELAENLSRSASFDTVLVLDAAGTTVAENLGALVRAGQLIAFGDDAISMPTGFEIEPRAIPLGREINSPSVFNETRRIYGSEVLRKSYRTSSQALARLINQEFYQNRIEFEPSAGEYLGERSYHLDLVLSENRATTTFEGATESLDAEVARAIETVLNHATWHPEQSLLLVSASSVHAERVRVGINEGLKARPELAEFFRSHGREKFEVLALSDLTHRNADRVVFSIGFGRTSHGAVLSNFGQLSEPEGRRSMANLLVSARKSITVISCFAAEDIPADRLSNGALLLRDLLSAADATVESTDILPDPMLNDLSLRLKKLGARVDQSLSVSMPLVVSYAKRAAVIEPDWSIRGENRNEKFRIRPGLLKALGWQYIRVHSFEVFSDPQAIAQRIAEQLGMQISKRPTPLFDPAERAFEDSDAAWGDRTESNDARLRGDKPPHWG